MKFKKFKIIFFIIIAILLLLMIGKTCKKANALSSGFSGYSINISERDQGQYSYISIYNLKSNLSNDTFNYIYRTSQDSYYLYSNNNQVSVYRYNNGQYIELTNFSLTTGCLQVLIDYDAADLCLIVYELSIDLQVYQGSSPAFGGIIRTLKARVVLDLLYLDQWQNDDLNITFIPTSSGLIPGLLLNYSYISSTDALSDINNWVDNQLENSLLFNNLLVRSYYYGTIDGYEDGYNIGVGDGEDVGYENGYTDGYDTGYSEGTIDGEEQGYINGYDTGYTAGYDAGQEGETAISPAFRVITDIFVSLGSLLAIELVPNVPLGLFFLVPLFFAIVGLILWIWRRN